MTTRFFADTHFGHTNVVCLWGQFSSSAVRPGSIAPTQSGFASSQGGGQDLIAEHRPRLAICCGKSFWPDFRRLFPGTEFQPATLRHPTDSAS